jgi:glycosyltransferase involved in cell wall biosynthesis
MEISNMENSLAATPITATPIAATPLVAGHAATRITTSSKGLTAAKSASAKLPPMPARVRPPAPSDLLRIAVIGPRGVPNNYSGVERIVEELFEYIAAKGHHVTVYCRPGVIEQPTGMYKGIRLVRAPAPGGKNFETLSHSFFSTLHAVRRGDIHDEGQKFDVISYHTIAPGLFTPIARLAGVPVINHIHGLDWQRDKWKGLGSRVLRQCEKTMVRHATKVVGVNQEIVDYYKTNYNLEVPLLPNGVNKVTETFTPDAQVLNNFGLTPRGYIVCVGRLVPEKRIGDTIAAFAKVPGDFKLVFVGEGKHSPEYVQQMHALGAADKRVVFTGLQRGAALETLFRCARLYVTASGMEGLPSSLLECMERKIPAIASDITPHRALLGGVPGHDWLFPVGDVAALTSMITAALADDAKSDALGEKERQFVRQHYSWPVLADATLNLYRQVLGRTSQQSM